MDLDEFRALQSLPCRSGKYRYETKREALSSLSAHNVKFRGTGKANAYRCDWCGCWHLGRR